MGFMYEPGRSQAGQSQGQRLCHLGGGGTRCRPTGRGNPGPSWDQPRGPAPDEPEPRR